MLSKLESFKLQSYKASFGEMTSEEALQTALNSEAIKKSMSPFDQAYAHFAEELRTMFIYAELLEKEENSK